MTSLGKTLVLVNMLFSGLAAVWAFGLYYNNVDWSDKPTGKLGQSLAKIDAMKPGAAATVKAWHKNRDEVWTLQQDLGEDRVFYAAKIKQNESGDGPALEVAREKNFPMLDGKRLKLVEARVGEGPETLLSLAAYDKLGEEKTGEVLREARELNKQILLETKYTEDMAGTEKTKGLLERVAIEKEKIRRLVEEFDRLQPLVTLARNQSRQVILRRDEMKSRREELDRYLQRVYKIQMKTP